ncbi:MAG: hypothetical protein V7K26_27245 [Nostoc sp.]
MYSQASAVFSQYGKARDAMNRRQEKRLIIVLTAIYRVFVMIYRIFSNL